MTPSGPAAGAEAGPSGRSHSTRWSYIQAIERSVTERITAWLEAATELTDAQRDRIRAESKKSR